MSLIINIDTATTEAHVSIARDGEVLYSISNQSQKEHAAFLQPAILELTRQTGIALQSADAVAVTAGPGSYTGLRVGMASAKGLCYALGLPFITINSLELLAASALMSVGQEKEGILCPMIDARRMEVFTAIYDTSLTLIKAPQALVLEAGSFEEELKAGPVLFFGSGAQKWKDACINPNARFATVEMAPQAMARLSATYFDAARFTQLADSEPLYIKEFYFKKSL